MAGLKQSRGDADTEAYGTLLELAPDFLKDFARRDALAVERYYREAITRTGETARARQSSARSLLADNLEAAR